MTTSMASKVRAGVVLPAAYALVRDSRFALLESVLERDAWSAEQIRAHQAERLTSLFRMCREHNPYWSSKFTEFGVNPNGSDPFAELAKLPILTKDEIRANWKRMRSTHLSKSDVVHETSSGSTGMQINFYQSRHYRQLHAAMEYRSRAWMGVRPGEPYISIQAHGAHMTRKTRLFRGARAWLENGFILDAFHLDPAKMREQLIQARKLNPVHVHGYATSCMTVAEFARDAGLTDWPSVRAVSTTSEQQTPEHRKTLGDVFGAHVYDRYGSREVLSISMQCPEGGHHIYADMNFVEFAPVSELGGELSAIVVTPLDNEAMPLFRYRGGDEAAPIDGACACGRILPLMTGCRGRVCNNFITPDGRIVNGTYFLYYFYYQEGFKSYQFHQTTPDHIDLYVVPDGALTQERHDYLKASCRKIADDYASQFNVDLHIVDSIPKRPGGKHLYIISDVLRHI